MQDWLSSKDYLGIVINNNRLTTMITKPLMAMKHLNHNKVVDFQINVLIRLYLPFCSAITMNYNTAAIHSSSANVILNVVYV